MQADENHDAGPSGLPGSSSSPDASSSRFQPSANMVRRSEISNAISNISPKPCLVRREIGSKSLRNGGSTSPPSNSLRTLARWWGATRRFHKPFWSLPPATRTERTSPTLPKTKVSTQVAELEKRLASGRSVTLSVSSGTSSRSSTLISQAVAVKKMKTSDDIARVLGVRILRPIA